jgi:hypothetical protein
MSRSLKYQIALSSDTATGDKEYRGQMEVYIRDHSDGRVSAVFVLLVEKNIGRV